MNSRLRSNISNFKKSVEEKRRLFLKTEFQGLNIKNDKSRKCQLANTTVIASGKNPQRMLELVAENVVENKILKL